MLYKFSDTIQTRTYQFGLIIWVVFIFPFWWSFQEQSKLQFKKMENYKQQPTMKDKQYRLWLVVRVQTPNLKYYWTVASCDCGRSQILGVIQRWNLCLMTTPAIILTLNKLMTLNLTLTDPRYAFETFLCATIVTIIRNYFGIRTRTPSHFELYK